MFTCNSIYCSLRILSCVIVIGIFCFCMLNATPVRCDQTMTWKFSDGDVLNPIYPDKLYDDSKLNINIKDLNMIIYKVTVNATPINIKDITLSDFNTRLLEIISVQGDSGSGLVSLLNTTDRKSVV